MCIRDRYSSYRSISAAGTRPTSAANPPAAALTVGRRERQTDGRTLDRFMTLTVYYADGVIISGHWLQKQSLYRRVVVPGREVWGHLLIRTTTCGHRHAVHVAWSAQWRSHTSGVRGVNTGKYIFFWYVIFQCYCVITVRSIIQAV